MQCEVKFTMTTRKHHCRFCGQVYCNNCAPIRKAGALKKSSGGMRVCQDCHDYLMDDTGDDEDDEDDAAVHDDVAASSALEQLGGNPAPKMDLADLIREVDDPERLSTMEINALLSVLGIKAKPGASKSELIGLLTGTETAPSVADDNDGDTAGYMAQSVEEDGAGYMAQAAEDDEDDIMDNEHAAPGSVAVAEDKEECYGVLQNFDGDGDGVRNFTHAVDEDLEIPGYMAMEQDRSDDDGEGMPTMPVDITAIVSPDEYLKTKRDSDASAGVLPTTEKKQKRF